MSSGANMSTRLTAATAKPRRAASMIRRGVRVAGVLGRGDVAGREWRGLEAVAARAARPGASPRATDRPRAARAMALPDAIASRWPRCAAAARRPVQVQGDVAELAADTVGSGDEPPIGHDRATDPGRDTVR